MGCFLTRFVMLFSYMAQNQLIARTTVSPSTSCRPTLLVFAAVLLLCLPSPELPGTGCGVVRRTGCGGGYNISFRFLSRTSSLFLLQGNNSAVHRDVITDVYTNVVYAVGFAASTDALAQAHPRVLHDAEVKDYNRVLRARGRRLFKRQRETSSSASMIRTDTMVFTLQQTTCLQCGAKGWR